jgi:hypothetical protein
MPPTSARAARVTHRKTGEQSKDACQEDGCSTIGSYGKIDAAGLWCAGWQLPEGQVATPGGVLTARVRQQGSSGPLARAHGRQHLLRVP